MARSGPKASRAAATTSDTRAADGAASGVLALAANGEWAMLAPDGQFYDVSYETWTAYRRDPGVHVHGRPVAVTDQQQQALVFIR